MALDLHIAITPGLQFVLSLPGFEPCRPARYRRDRNDLPPGGSIWIMIWKPLRTSRPHQVNALAMTYDNIIDTLPIVYLIYVI